MKFAVYEVREDEKGKLAELAAKYSLDLALTASPLTMETLPLAEGASGVSTRLRTSSPADSPSSSTGWMMVSILSAYRAYTSEL